MPRQSVINWDGFKCNSLTTNSCALLFSHETNRALNKQNEQNQLELADSKGDWFFSEDAINANHAVPILANKKVRRYKLRRKGITNKASKGKNIASKAIYPADYATFTARPTEWSDEPFFRRLRVQLFGKVKCRNFFGSLQVTYASVLFYFICYKNEQ